MEEARREIELIKTLIDKVSSEYGFSESEILRQLKTPSEQLDASIFSNETLSPLEVLVKYLRENKFNKFSDIAKFLQRSQNTIQTTYKNAQKKHPSHLTFHNSSVHIPLSIFQTNKLTIFESLVKYLREEKMMANRDIAKLLKKSSKTIWTVYERVKKKQ